MRILLLKQGGDPLVRIPVVTVLDTVLLYGMNCTKRFVHMKRYSDYFTTIFMFLQKEGKCLGSHFLGGGGVVGLFKDLHACNPMVLIQERVVGCILQKTKWPPKDSEV